MPFPANWIEQRLVSARADHRLAHAYLLIGSNLEELQDLFQRLAAKLLQSTNPAHPDLHVIQPESKSRRLTVEQVRNLEHQLQLKARDSDIKVAGIMAADRMCIGSAEAANAFLKTLEEPPDHTVIFLLTDRPEQLLPTIRSRCLVLTLECKDSSQTTAPADRAWLEEWWKAQGTAADRAYRRAGLLAAHWKKLREDVERRFKDKEDDDSKSALQEAEFLLLRDNSLRSLIHYSWQRAGKELVSVQAARLVEGLEELRYALSRNMDQNIALERNFLMIEELIYEKD